MGRLLKINKKVMIEKRIEAENKLEKRCEKIINSLPFTLKKIITDEIRADPKCEEIIKKLPWKLVKKMKKKK